MLTDAIVKFVYPSDEMFFQLLKDFGIRSRRKSFSKAEFLAQLIDSIDQDTTEPRIVRWATSLVFELDRNGPDIQMEIEDQHVLSQTTEYYTFANPAYRVINQGEGILTEDQVADLVRERIKFPPKPKWINVAKGVFGVGKKGKGGKWQQQQYVVPGQQNIVPADTGMSDSEAAFWGGLDNVKGPAAGGKVKYVPPQPVVENKTEDPTYTLKELVKVFALSAYSYSIHRRHSYCRYSEYMHKLIEDVGVYQLGFQKKDVQHIPVGDLNNHILHLGDLVEDPDVITLDPTHNWSLNNVERAAKNILEFQAEYPDQAAIQFMTQFVNAHDVIVQNRVLEEYVGKVNATYQEALLAKLGSSELQKTGTKIGKGQDGKKSS